MSDRIPFLFKQSDGKPTSVTLYLDGKPYTLVSSAPLFDAVFTALKNNDVNALRRNLEVKKSLAEFSNGKFKLFEDTIYYNGIELKNCMVERILGLYKMGVGVEPLITFLENLLKNPSQTAIDELYLFLEQNDLPITEDGHFLAYKMVCGDFKSIHGGVVDNTPGVYVEMDRTTVDPERNNTCSSGLHFASLEYVESGSYGSIGSGHKLIVLKINPADVVTIPSDYNNSKGRAWRYLVLEEISWSDRIQAYYRPTNVDVTVYVPDDDDEGDDEICPDCGELHDDCTCDMPMVQPQVPEEHEGPLTEADVVSIWKLAHAGNFSLTQIGKMYGTHRTTIQRIRDRVSWTHVTDNLN